VFRPNRQVIEEEVRRKYVAGDTEVDGSILIRLDDLPERLLAPSRDALDS